jgi:hypothetical protein
MDIVYCHAYLLFLNQVHLMLIWLLFSWCWWMIFCLLMELLKEFSFNELEIEGMVPE